MIASEAITNGGSTLLILGRINDCLWGDQHCWSWGSMIASEVITSDGINTVDPGVGQICNWKREDKQSTFTFTWKGCGSTPKDQQRWSPFLKKSEWKLTVDPLFVDYRSPPQDQHRQSPFHIKVGESSLLILYLSIMDLPPNRGDHLFTQKWKLTVDPLFVDDCWSPPPRSLCPRTFRAKILRKEKALNLFLYLQAIYVHTSQCLCRVKNLWFGKRDQMWMLNFWGIMGFTIDNRECTYNLTRIHNCQSWGVRERIHNWHLKMHTQPAEWWIQDFP